MNDEAHILVVDDDHRFRETLCDILKIKGYAPKAASTGNSALESIAEKRPAVALIDLNLEDISGLEVMSRIKEHYPDTECIMITGHASQSTALEAVKLGAYSYMQKPCDMDQLLVFIRRAVEKQEAEMTLRESEEKFRDLFENANDLIQIVDMDGKFLYVNRKWLEVVGYSKDEVRNLTLWKIIHKEHIDEFKELFEELCNGADLDKIETVFISKTGREIYVEGNANAQFKEGKLIATRGIFRNITERKQAEKIQQVLYNISQATSESGSLNELLETIHQQLGTLIDVTNFYIALYDREGDIYSFPYYVDQYDDDFSPQPLKNSLTDYVRRTGKPLLADKKVHDQLKKKGEVELVGPDSPIWLGVSFKTAHDIEGVLVVQSYTDSTLYSKKDLELLSFVSEHIAIAIERKQAEKELKESEQRFKAIFDNASDGILLVDIESNTFNNANKTFCQMLDYSLEEIRHLNMTDIHPNHAISYILEAFEKQLKREVPLATEIPVKRKDNSIFYADVNSTPIQLGDEKYLLCIYRDITERKEADEKLRESDNRLKTIFNSIGTGMLLIDAKTHEIVDINPAATKMIGKTKEKIIGNMCHEYICQAQKGECPVTDLGQTIDNSEQILLHSTGEKIPILKSITPITINRRKHLIESFIDITEQKKAEKEIKKKTHELGERIKEVNCLYGISRLMAQPHISLDDLFNGIINIIPKSWQYPDITCAKIIFGGTEFGSESFIKKAWKKSNSIVVSGLSADIKILGKEAGSVDVYYLEEKPEMNEGPFTKEERNLIDAIAREIGKFIERKIAEEERIRFFQATKASIDGIIIADLEGKISYANEAFCRMWKYTSKEAIGMSIFDFWIEAEHKKINEQMIPSTMEGGWSGELQGRKKDEANFPVLVSSSIIKDYAGKATAMLGSFRDITQQKEWQKKLEESERRYRSLFENVREGIYASTPEGKFKNINDEMVEIFGFQNREELLAIKSIKQLYQSVRDLRRLREEVEKEGFISNYEIDYQRKDGKIIHCLESCVAVRDEQGKVVEYQGTITNITEQKKLAQKIKESKVFQDNLIESMGEGLIVSDTDDKILIVNRAAEQILGVKAKELKGKSVYDFHKLESKAKVEALIKRYKLTKKKETKEIQIGLNNKVIRASISPIYSSERKFSGVALILQDITRIVEVDRMKTDFVSSVSHELRTPLASITGFASTILNDPEMDEDTKKEFVSIIHEDGQRLSRLIEDLLDIAKIESGRIKTKKELINIKELIEKTAEELRPRANKAKITMHLNMDDGIEKVVADPDQMKQVVVNLITNAIKFTPQDGKIFIHLRREDNKFTVEVEDTGMGIPSDDLDKVFDKFHRVYRPGMEIQGTGLGLPIVKDIVKKHNGKISLQSEVNKGTIVRFSIPLGLKKQVSQLKDGKAV